MNFTSYGNIGGIGGSITEKIINQVSGPCGLNMSGPNNYRNDLGYRAGNAITNPFSILRR